MLGGHVADQLLQDHRLAHTGPAEQARLAALRVGLQQVDHFDARFQHLGGGAQFLVPGRRAVDGVALISLNGALAVDGLADHIKQAAQGLGPHRHADGLTRILHRSAPCQPVGGVHGHRPHQVLTQVQGHFQHQPLAVAAVDLQSVVDLWQVLVLKGHVHHGTHDLRNFAFFHSFSLKRITAKTPRQV